MKNNIVLEIISALLILLFLYTALSKLFDWQGFYGTIGTMPYINDYAFFVAAAVPLAEIIATAFLILPKYRKWGFYVSLILLLLFTGYLILMVFTTSSLPCSCGGVLKYLSWKQHILFNISFIILDFIGIRLLRTGSKTSFIAIEQELPNTCINK